MGMTRRPASPYTYEVPPPPLCRWSAEPQKYTSAAFAFFRPITPPPKANLYIDGFNLYHGSLCKTQGCKWLNPRAFAEAFFPQVDIKTIKYFSAEISSNPADEGASSRQRAYWRALQTDKDLAIIKGRFFTKKKTMPLANRVPKGNCREADCPKGQKSAEVRVMEEKMSDVNLATHMLADGFLGLYEVAIVISNDTDLCAPINAVRETVGREVWVVRPVSNPGRRPSKGLEEVASKVKDITPKRLSVVKRCQYPRYLEDAKGTITKPERW